MCLWILMFFASCATVIPPSGGEKDVAPPKILQISPINKMTNFNTNEITVFFDEYIELKNESDIFCYPIIEPFPEIKTKGRSLVIKLHGELKLNTTYIINFNNSIVDINESNVLEGFKYFFSTGPVIDTCQVVGSTFNLTSNQIVPKAIVGLYKNQSINHFDSLVRSSAPDYFVFSDNNGDYILSNLEKGGYILYGLKDSNLNKKYESNELISMPIEVSVSAESKINIPLFVEKNDANLDSLNCFYSNLQKDSTNFGVVNFSFKEEVYENNNYVGELLLNDSIIYCFKISGATKQIDSLATGEYIFRIFEDSNKNSIWDPGVIKNLIPPESIIFFKNIISVKKDWEIDLFFE